MAAPGVTTLSHFWNSPADRSAACKRRAVVRALRPRDSGPARISVRPLHPSAFSGNEATKMKTLQAIAFAALAVVSAAAFAAAPVLKVSKEVTINAPASEVWAKIKNFDGLATWHPALEKDEIVAGKNNEVGAERLLSLKGGGTIKEKLLAFDDKHHSFKYSILEGVLPVSDYTSTISVKSAGKGKSTVTWSGWFKRKDTGAKPAADADDATATKTMSGVYQGGLDNLKKMMESGSR
jgi:mxaD protein